MLTTRGYIDTLISFISKHQVIVQNNRTFFEGVLGLGGIEAANRDMLLLCGTSASPSRISTLAIALTTSSPVAVCVIRVALR